MTPYGKALLNHHRASGDSLFTLHRDDGFTTTVSAGVFFSSHFSDLEQRALALCHGRILDIGAGAGRHALELQRRGLRVCAIDILPEATSVMKERGVQEVLLGDVMKLEGASFDSLLMLMNGIGMAGTPSQLDHFLVQALNLIADGGCLLCDSIDVSRTVDPIHVRYREQNVQKGLYPGQQFYTASYANEVSEPFPWLHIDFAALDAHAQKNQWTAELVLACEDGHYLAKLTKKI